MWPFALRRFSPDESSGPAPGPDPALAPFFDATADAMMLFGPDFIVTAGQRGRGPPAARAARAPARPLRARARRCSPACSATPACRSACRARRGVVRDEVTVADVEGQPLQCRVEALRLDGRARAPPPAGHHAPRCARVAALRSLEELHRAAARGAARRGLDHGAARGAPARREPGGRAAVRPPARGAAAAPRSCGTSWRTPATASACAPSSAPASPAGARSTSTSPACTATAATCPTS